jgi:hypothetical protein
LAILPVAAGCQRQADSGAATASEPVGHRYATTSFAVALAVSVDDSLKPSPTIDSHGLLSWDSAANADDKIRFLVPAKVYAPGASEPMTPPDDYAAYLSGLSKFGARLTDVTTVTIGGRTATESTATSADPPHSSGGYWDGTLGCPSPESTNVDDCFGIQPEYLLRLAVLDVSGTPLLAWARVPTGSPDPHFFAVFDAMLASVAFR